MVINLETGQKLVGKLVIADRFWPRFWGLMMRKEPLTNEGCLLTPCKGVHTFFMRFPIDVVYLDSEYKVLDLFEKVQPWKVLPINKKAKHVLELPTGTIDETGTSKGQHLKDPNSK